MKTKTTRKNKFLATLLLIAVLLTTLPTEAFAGTITKGNQTLSITEGLAALTVDGNEYKLTKPLVTTDGVIDNIGTVYLTVKGGNLYFCSYKYQGKNVDLIFLASGVTVLTETGYGTESGHNNFLTEEEVKSKLGINNSSNNGSNNNNSGNNSSNNNNTTSTGVYAVGNNTVLYNDGTKTYILSQGQVVDEVWNIDKVAYIRFVNGDIKKWDYDKQKNETTVKLNLVATGTKALAKSNGKVTGYYDVNGQLKDFNSTSTPTTVNVTKFPTLYNNQAILNIMENGKITKQYILSSGKLLADWMYNDANGTTYVKYQDGSMKIWNYDLQKSENKVNMIPLATKVKDPIVSNGKIIGYTTENSSIMQPIWTLDQVKVAVALNASNNNTANNTNSTANTTTNTSKEKYKVSHKSGSAWYYLKNSKGKVVDKYKYSKGKVHYHGWKFSVKQVWFNEKGNLIIRGTKVTKVVNRNTMQLKTISKITKSVETENGFAKWLTKTNGKQVNLAKY